jgi:hypothetical protein
MLRTPRGRMMAKHRSSHSGLGLDWDLEPEEGDLVTSDHVHFYANGRRVVTVDADASKTRMWRQLDAYMKSQNFYPNVWFISDHGNAHIMSRPKLSIGRKEKRRALAAAAGLYPHRRRKR